MPDVDPTNSYGTPEGPELTNTVAPTEPEAKESKESKENFNRPLPPASDDKA